MTYGVDEHDLEAYLGLLVVRDEPLPPKVHPLLARAAVLAALGEIRPG